MGFGAEVRLRGGNTDRRRSLGLLDLAGLVRMPRTSSWDILSRPFGTDSCCQIPPRTYVLGYSQPSLRD
jgi:hypothetical protein